MSQPVLATEVVLSTSSVVGSNSASPSGLPSVSSSLVSNVVSPTAPAKPAPVPKEKPEKILITGTGRCGTTFLIRMFTLLGLDTGYTPETMEKFTYPKCNAGMERPIGHQVLFIKNPVLVTTLPEQLKTFRLSVILPLRNFNEAAESRARIGARQPGGLWASTDVSGQLDNYEKWVCKALIDIVQNDIPYIFLDFKRMTTCPEYLFKALDIYMTRFQISYEKFLEAWQKAGDISRPKDQLAPKIDSVKA